MADALQLANFLGDLDPSKVRTVAYVPSEARSDAAIIALACDQLVVHPRTVLGGSGAHELSPDEVKDVVRVIRELAPRKGRSWSLMAAMIDSHLDVYRATRAGDVEYFCNEERNEQAEPAKWKMDEPVTRRDKPCKSMEPGRKSTTWPTTSSTISPNSNNATGWKRIRHWSSRVGRRC